MALPNLNDTTIELSHEELKEHLVNQTINHGLEIQQKDKEIAALKKELVDLLWLLLNNGYHKIGERTDLLKRIEELES